MYPRTKSVKSKSVKCSKEKAKAIQAAFDKAVRDATTLHQEIRKGEFAAQSSVHIINSKERGVDDVLASRSDEKVLKLA